MKTNLKILSILSLIIALSSSAGAHERDRRHNHQADSRHHAHGPTKSRIIHHHHLRTSPKKAQRVVASYRHLPRGHRLVRHHGRSYAIHNGACYHRHGQVWVLTKRPW
ncbi:MAG: hypothetical protein ACQKBY_03385 [Verrucomicrobiales bacterium]